ncbi:hypothetical protein PMIT1323_00289 [Prochlorococcus marinus str. MIT 1323]|nr:hypothetical protein PMIT1323_00289 [Prochlorococcus marinus str. MIT 1323]
MGLSRYKASLLVPLQIQSIVHLTHIEQSAKTKFCTVYLHRLSYA